MASIYPKIDLDSSQIRVVTLHSSPNWTNTANISCSLKVISSPAHQPFEALSYVCGPTTGRCKIEVNGQFVVVYDNLYAALQSLSRATQGLPSTRTLWIDALCIDQFDTVERNRQVERMTEIYSHASRVLVWLGEPDKEISDVVDLYLSGALKHGLEWYDTIKTVSGGIEKLLSLEWWKRMWTFQEFIVPTSLPTVGLGQNWLPWEFIEVTVEAVSLNRLMTERSYRADDNPISTSLEDAQAYFFLRRLRDIWHDPHKRTLILPEVVLILTCRRLATDPHDHIYSIIGLLERHRDSLSVNYKLSIKELYQAATVKVLESSGDTQILVHAPDARNADLPSWCVDFSSPGWFQMSKGKQVNKMLNGIAGNLRSEDAAFVRYDPLASSLTVRSSRMCKIDRLEIFEYPLPKHTDPYMAVRDFCAKVLRFTRAARSALSLRMSTDYAEHRLNSGLVWQIWFENEPFERVWDKLKSMLTQSYNISWEKPNYPTGYSFFEQLMLDPTISKLCLEDQCSWAEWGWIRHQNRFSDEMRKAGYLMLDVMLRWQEQLGSCTLITTAHGHLAKVEKVLQPKDILCQIQGCNQTAVLRPCPLGSTFWLVSFVLCADSEDKRTVWPSDYPDADQKIVLI